MHSLRARLALMIVLVTGLAVAAVGLLSSSVTSSEFRRYVASDDVSSLERCASALIEYYRNNGQWSDVQQTIDRIGSITDKQLILLDANGNVVGAAPAEMRESQITVTPDHKVTWRREERKGAEVVEREFVLVGVPHAALSDDRGRPIGTLYVTSLPAPPGAGSEARFVGAVNRSLIVAVLAAGCAALLLTLVLSRRFLRPIESLTAAVRRIESGDLAQKVAPISKDEIGELARAFNSMTEKLARTEELRRNMVSDIAHELRTPLTNIRCQLETLQDGLASAGPAVIDSLHEEVMLLARLIDDLQELALADAGKLKLSCGPISIGEAVVAAVKALSPVALEKQIEIRIEQTSALPPVYADSQRIGQVLRNLLSNALAHTPPGGRVEIESRQVDGYIQTAVRDTGDGIPPGHLPYIFERFYRTDNSRTRATGGAGLGLAIVKQLVIAHGGDVSVESAPGQGSVFSFTLPIAFTP
jgi:signal transduction histidine kinase